MIKLITIDFWNTLYDNSFGEERNKYRMRTLVEEVDKLGVMVKGDEFDRAMRASWEHFNDIWIKEQRTPSAGQTTDFFWNYLKLTHDVSAIQNVSTAMMDSVLVFSPLLINGAKKALEILSKKFDLAIISDTGFSPGTILKQLLKRDGIFDYFGAFSFSDESGAAKPNPKAFKTAINHWNYKPSECIHIGDIEFTDVKGAKAIGMKSIRFTGDETKIIENTPLKDSQADYVAQSWEEVLEIIESIS